MRRAFGILLLLGIATGLVQCGREHESPAAHPRTTAEVDESKWTSKEKAAVESILRGTPPNDTTMESIELCRQVGYVGSPHPQLAAFDTILASPNGVDMAESILRRGSLAARLYGLILLRDLASDRFESWARDFDRDETMVWIGQGCTGKKARVRDFTTQRVRAGFVTLRPRADKK